MNFKIISLLTIIIFFQIIFSSIVFAELENWVPTACVDQGGDCDVANINVSDGTYEIQTLKVAGGAYINATAWNTSLPDATIINITFFVQWRNAAENKGAQDQYIEYWNSSDSTWVYCLGPLAETIIWQDDSCWTTGLTAFQVNQTKLILRGYDPGQAAAFQWVDHMNISVEYNFPPQWSANTTTPLSPVEYNPPVTQYKFQIEWNDEQINDVIFEWTNSTGTYNFSYLLGQVQKPTILYEITFWDLPANDSGYTYTWYANDSYNEWNSTDPLTYVITKNDSGIMKLWLNGTENHVSYATNSVANFTALLNLSSKTIKLASNYTGFEEITNTTSVIYNTTTLSTEGDFWNLTAYWTGDENYTSHLQYYYFNVTSVVFDSAFSVAFPTAYENETVTGTTKLTATELATWISFNFTEAEQNWVEPWANGSASLPQAGPTQPIFIIYLTGNQNSNFTVNMSTPSGIAVCVNASCAGGDCADEQNTCTAIDDNYVKLGRINAGKAMNVTFYGNVSKSIGPGTYDSGPLWINNTKA